MKIYKNPEDIMSIKEIKRRIKNPFKYKQQSLISDFKNQIKNNTEDGINNKYDIQALKDVLKGKRINVLFKQQFPDEPTDQEINEWKKKNMRNKKMNEQTKKDIKKVVKYLWSEEQKHFEESNKPKNHIFRELRRINFEMNLGFKE